MEAEIQTYLTQFILNRAKHYLELSVEQLIEDVWRDDDAEKKYNLDFPEDMIISILEKLQEEGRIEWDRDSKIIRLKKADQLDDFRQLAEPKYAGLWQITLRGEYYLLGNDEVTMDLIHKKIEENELNLGKLHYFYDEQELTLDWSFGGIRCDCNWAKDHFTITSLMFEEPSKEFLNYANKLLETGANFLLSAISFSGAYLLYEFMKSIILSLYPTATFILKNMKERMTRRD